MCLITFAWDAHPDWSLVIAANRDEFHARPTEAAHWWDDDGLLAGKDMQAGGTWLAVNRAGRFATVTNYREQSFTKIEHTTRGSLPVPFVTGTAAPLDYVDEIDGDEFAGFNILAADMETMAYVSNRGDKPVQLDAGVYGLSNASLDMPWSKVVRTKATLESLIEQPKLRVDDLFTMLADRTVTDENVHAEHLDAAQARAITAPFIVSETYGTRSSTVYLRDRTGSAIFVERRFDEEGKELATQRFEIDARS